MNALVFLIGGLVLFLYSIAELSSLLQGLFTEKAKNAISKGTRNLFTSLLVGTVITVLLGSSSAVIIILIIFINSKALSFQKGIGVIMGANIGTTFSSQLISLEITQYSYIPMIIGLLIQFFSKRSDSKAYGKAIFLFGLLFFGLLLMESSLGPLRESTFFEEWMQKIDDNYLKGSLIGGLVTLVIQSSSGTVGMAIILAKKNIISLSAGISIMLGAELGTCSDTLIATIKGSRQAIKAGLFHLFFNLTTILLGLLFFPYFLKLVEWISSGESINRMIANAHLLFNLLGVLLFLPLASPSERLLNYLIPEKVK